MATINRRSTRHASEAQQRQERSSGRSAAKRGRTEITTTAPTATASNSNSIATTTSTRSSHPNIPQQIHPARMKRPLEIIDTNLDHPKSKRARIAVEIISRSIPPGISPPKSIAVRPQSTTQTAAKPATVATTQRKLHQQRQQQPPPPPDLESPPPFAAAADQSTSHSQTATVDNSNENDQQSPLPSLTRHQEKVKNGIQHELDRLQPNATDVAPQPKEQGGRKLRSQEQTRFKSELSAYFPDYDEVIGNDPKEQHVLNVDTPIVVVDSNTTPDAPAHGVRILPSRHAAHQHAGPASHTTKPDSQLAHSYSTFASPNADFPVKSYGDELYTNLFDSEIVSNVLVQDHGDDDDEEDPLADEHYEPAHRRAERLEKSIRNTERGRAQHERDQIVRLLNELQGHDWLRTMGVNGVTESRKKTFEPARDHFIHGCQAILEKFRHWTQEEKRLKLERERALAEREAGSDGSEEPSESEEDEDEAEDSEQDDEMISADSDREIPDSVSDGDPPDHSDVDASIAKQLHEEALAQAKYTASTGARRSRADPPPHPEFYAPPREFTSFFSKRHERDAALRKSRRGRIVMAWGHPIPEIEEDDFDLSEEYRDEDYMKSRARRKRRDKRGRKA
ncbi:iq calmodulin-binding domain-containing protein [Apiospora phragmitis]|uniref:Iq calmodulin-binding domain-containing protein n=1 Tax=Apiospora phragmitis TaxID=2905665 RepID=A0ABR1URH8_9PEZI